MPEVPPKRLALEQRHLELLRELLRRHLPQAEVWAYGSRINGTGHAASDLDLLVRNPANLQAESPGVSSLRTALLESNLPIRVDVADWARIPPEFRREIEAGYVVIDAVAEN